MSARSGRLRAAVGLVAATLAPGAAMLAAGEGPAAAQTTPASAVPNPAQGLRQVGFSDLGGGGLNGDVAVVGTTAVVAAGQPASGAFVAGVASPIPCPDVAVKVVDLSDPTRPRVAATIALDPGVIAADVDALRVRTPTFTGDVAAVALTNTACSPAIPTAEKGVAYYDISNPAAPVLLGRYQANFDNVAPDAGPCSTTATQRCAANQWSVSLAQRTDGRVISLSVFRGGASFPSGELRVVDVTNPRTPTQIGFYPSLDERPQGFSSNNGCRPFFSGQNVTAYAGGTRALLTYLDQGLYDIDLADPAAPATLTRVAYPTDDRSVEGQASQASVAEVGGRRLAVLSEADWVPTTTSVRIDGPAAIAGSKFACQSVFSALDPDGGSQLAARPGSQISAPIVFVGRGCPVAGSVAVADPYLGDPRGRIALLDRNPTVQTGLAGICSFSDRVGRAQAAGALGVIFADTNPPPAFAPDGDPRGLDIPSVIIETPDATALRSTICPALVDGACSGGQAVTGAMVDRPGEWGGLRVLDITNSAAPTQRAVFNTARSRAFPPPDAGIYAVERTVTRGSRAYAAWNSDGLRVLDLSADTPVEIASFVPRDTADPTRSGTLPAKALVRGVAVTDTHIVITDVNSGLYVLELDQGYWTVASDGGVFAFGGAPFLGSTGAVRLNSPVVGLAPTPSRRGYWLVAADGGVFAFGDARFLGSTGATALARPVVGMAATPSGRGYWLAAADGGVFAFGDAVFHGSTGALRLGSPIVAMSATPTGRGYWLAAADGGVFAFGDARFLGSTGAIQLAKPVVAMAATPSGNGYWMVASDGGLFSFGDAGFLGSTGAIRLNRSIVGLTRSATGNGYWMTAADGGIFAFGDARFLGSTGAVRLARPVVGIAAAPG